MAVCANSRNFASSKGKKVSKDKGQPNLKDQRERDQLRYWLRKKERFIRMTRHTALNDVCESRISLEKGFELR